MKRFLQIAGACFLAYSVAGILLHFLARMEIFGHHCELLFVPGEEEHLQIFTGTAIIATVLFTVVQVIMKRRLKKAV